MDKPAPSRSANTGSAASIGSAALTSACFLACLALAACGGSQQKASEGNSATGTGTTTGGGATGSTGTGTTDPSPPQGLLPPVPNGEGASATVTLAPSGAIDTTTPFFKPQGNGRSCATCHDQQAGWSITPDTLGKRFKETDGLDPVFRTNDGAVSPRAPVATTAEREKAYALLLSKGLIRVGLPIPAGAEFELVSVDDPYQFASAAELSLFRRPLPTTNLRFQTALMWDGRESPLVAPGAAVNCIKAAAGQSQGQGQMAACFGAKIKTPTL